MDKSFSTWIKNFPFGGNVRQDALSLLRYHQLDHIAEHTERVAKEAIRLAEQFHVDPRLADAAFVYLDYLWAQRTKLRVIHPWLKEAYLQLRGDAICTADKAPVCRQPTLSKVTPDRCSLSLWPCRRSET